MSAHTGGDSVKEKENSMRSPLGCIKTLRKNQVLFCLLASFTALSMSSQAHQMSERERIQSHLTLVEQLLRERPVTELSEAQKTNRIKGLDVLKSYIEQAVFPVNTHHKGERHPYFIDHSGIPCAVGQIMLEVNGRDLALKIAATQNYKYLDEMEGDEILAWVQQSGFSFDELRLVQPSYSYESRYSDPILEAAYLVDKGEFSKLLSDSKLTVNSEPYKRYINDALRVLAPIANWDREMKKNRSIRGGRGNEMHEPPPRKTNGIDFVKYLLALGADPNDQSEGRSTIVFETKDSDVRKLLIDNGGKLTTAETFLDAIEKADLKKIEIMLSDTQFQPYSNQSHLPTPLLFAISRIRSMPYNRKIVPLASDPDPSIKVIYHLLKHSSKKIDLYEERPAAKDRYDRSTAILEIIRNRDLRSVLQFALNDSFQIKNQETFISLFGFYLDNTFPEYPLPRTPLSPDFAKKLESLLIREKKWISVEPISYDQHFAFSSVSMGNYVASGNQAAVSFLRKFDISPATNDYFVLPKYLFGLKGKITPKALKKIKLIVKAGAELNTHYKNAYPIAFATEHRNIELMHFFLESGSFANIWPSNPEICPPLAIAVENADIKAIKLLKKFKADTEANYNRALGTCISSKQKRNQNKKAEMVKISEMTMSPQVRAAFEGP